MEGGDETESTPLLARQRREVHDRGPWFGVRHLFCLLGFLGFANVYAMRVNLTVAIVAMINNTAVDPPAPPHPDNGSNVCPTPPNPTNHTLPPSDGPFAWTTSQQGVILGAFFWGYVISQLPGGRMAEASGGKYVFGIGILITAIFSIVTPLAARAGFYLLILVRFIEGLGEGVTYPTMHAMLAKWAPDMERTKLSTLVYSGSTFGTIVSLPLSGLLCDAVGWESVFYIFGSLGVVWFFFWVGLVHNTPSEHPTITAAERRHIEGEPKPTRAAMPAPPWGKIFSSVRVWAIIVAHVSQNYGFYTLLNELPTYMKQILHFNIKEDAALSAVPYLAAYVISIAGSIVADHVRERRILSTTIARKVFNSIAFFGPAATLLLLPYAGCDKTTVVTLLSLTVGLNGLNSSGVGVNHIDIAPNYAGTLMGISNMASNTMGFITPWIVSVVTEGHEDLDHWQIIFVIAAITYIVGNVVFLAFATGEIQDFNDIPPPPPPEVANAPVNADDEAEPHVLDA